MKVEYIDGKGKRKKKGGKKRNSSRKGRTSSRRRRHSSSKFDFQEILLVGAGALLGGLAIRELKKTFSESGTSSDTAKYAAPGIPIASGFVLPKFIKGSNSKMLKPLLLGAAGMGIAVLASDLMASDTAPAVVSISGGYSTYAPSSVGRNPSLVSSIRGGRLGYV